jgi:hypothetical protein
VYYAEGVKINLRDMKKLVLSIGVVFVTTFTVFGQGPSNAISYVDEPYGLNRFIKNIKAYNLKLSLTQVDTMEVEHIPTYVISDCFFSDSIIIDPNFAMQAYVYADMMFEDLLSRRGDEFKEILSSRNAQGNRYAVTCTNVIIKNPKAEGNLNYYLFKLWNMK